MTPFNHQMRNSMNNNPDRLELGQGNPHTYCSGIEQYCEFVEIFTQLPSAPPERLDSFDEPPDEYEYVVDPVWEDYEPLEEFDEPDGYEEERNDGYYD